MSERKTSFKEGDIFAVPLGNGRNAFGLIARKQKKYIALGYFFNIVFSAIPESVDAWVIVKERTALIAQFSALGIVNGEWPIIKTDFIFIKDDWPIPEFAKQDPLTDLYYSILL